MTWKLPTPLVEAIQKHAARHGMTSLDFVGETLAREVGIPYMEQEVLPLDRSA